MTNLDQALTLKRFVQRDEFLSPSELVDSALAFGLRVRPEFEVLESVVGTITVPMMDGLCREQRSPDVVGHDEPMFEEGASSA